MATQVKTGLIANDAITDAKIANVALTGVTASSGDSSTSLATTAFVTTEINSLIDSAPGALNTLNELAAALGDDANFSTTVTNSIATKLPLAGGTLTGNLVVDIGNSGNDSFIELKNTGYTGNITSLRQNADSTRAELNSTERPIYIQAGSSGSASSAEIRIYANQQLGLTIDANKKATFGGNIELTGGGTISSPSVSGGEGLGLQAAGTITVLIDSNSNSGDDQFFKVQKHTNTDLFTVKETGDVEIPSGSLKVINSGTDAYFFEGVRSGGNVTLRMYDNNNNLYIDSYTNMNFRVNQTGGGSGGNFAFGGGNVAIGAGTANDILDIRKANSQLRLTDTDDSKFVQFSYSGGKLIVRNNSTNTTVNQFTILENGNFGIGTINPTAPLDVSEEIGSNIAQTSTYNYGSNRNWAMKTNNYGSSNWGGWVLEQSTSNGGTPSVARIGVHLNGNVGINMGGDASSGLTDINPATALHVGGDITVGSADAVGTGGTASIRFQNDNERSRITSNYASGGGGQMGFWTDTTGGSLLQRAYIKNNGEFNLQAGLRLNGYNYVNSDVFKTYYLTGPGSSTTTRTVNINTYFGFGNGTGGYFMMALHGWQTDSAAGLIHWHNGGSSGPMTSAYFEPFYTPTGLTVSVAKGTGDYDIDITLTGTHTNSHGWRMNVWG